MSEDKIPISLDSTNRSLEQPQTHLRLPNPTLDWHRPDEQDSPEKPRPSLQSLLESNRSSLSYNSDYRKALNQVGLKLQDKLNILETKFNQETRVTEVAESPVPYRPSEDAAIILEGPSLRWCPYCQRETVNDVYYKNSAKTFWSSLGIFLMGGVFGCFMLPYLSTSCKDPYFVCARCKHTLN